MKKVIISTANQYGGYSISFRNTRQRPMVAIIASENYFLGKKDHHDNPKTVCNLNEDYSIISLSGDQRKFYELPLIVETPIGTYAIDENMAIEQI